LASAEAVFGDPETRRVRHATNDVETIARPTIPKTNAYVSGGQGNMRVRIGSANPLLPMVECTMFPDGGIAIWHASEYQVVCAIPNGQKTLCPTNIFTPIRMTEAENHAENLLRNAGRRSSKTVSGKNSGDVTRSARVDAGYDVRGRGGKVRYQVRPRT
jgi:hypothetical protein